MKQSRGILTARRAWATGLCSALIAIAIIGPAEAAKPTFITVNVAGAQSTQLTGINSSGTATGNYITTNGVQFGFVRAPDGSITSFSAGSGTLGTTPLSINARGDIAGTVKPFPNEGFVRTADGTITLFGVLDCQQILSFAFNNKDVIVGSCLSSNSIFGFVRGAKGRIKNLVGPGSTPLLPEGVNSEGDIVGYYPDSNAVLHGFLLTADGTFTTIDPPNSAATNVTAINFHSDIVGSYSTGDGGYPFHGFVRSPDGNFTSFDAKQGSRDTSPTAIDFGGKVVGYFEDVDPGTGKFDHTRVFTQAGRDHYSVRCAAPAGRQPNTADEYFSSSDRR